MQQGLQPSHPTRPIFRELTRRCRGGGPVLRTLNSGPRPLFRGPPGALASALLRGLRFRSGSARGHGPLSRPPRIAVQGRFFGAPRGHPPARCSAARNFRLAARYFIRSMAIGRNRDKKGPAQQIVVPRPAHLGDATDNVAHIQNSDRRRAAVG